MRKQSSISSYTKQAAPGPAGNRMTTYVTPASGRKRPADDTAYAKASAPGDSRQAKFRRLIGDGESKDLDSYRQVVLPTARQQQLLHL